MQSGGVLSWEMESISWFVAFLNLPFMLWNITLNGLVDVRVLVLGQGSDRCVGRLFGTSLLSGYLVGAVGKKGSGNSMGV